MLKRTRYFAALGAVFFASVALAACGGGIPGNAVVNIDGAGSITKDAYGHWLSVAAASTTATGEKQTVPVPPQYTACIAHLKATAPKPAKGQKAPTEAALKTQCQQQYKSLQQEVLGFLISSSWVLGEAKSLGVKVSDKEVENQFLHIKHQQFPKPAEFEKFLSTSGQSVSDLLLRVKLNMLSQKIQQKIIKKKPKVSDAEAQKYYNQNKSRYGVPEHRNVEIILTKTEAQAASAKKEIEGGKSFSSVAKKVSIDPTSKAKGGLITETIKGAQEKNLDNALFSAKVNQLGGPLKTQFGYYLYEVLAIKAGSQEPFSAVEKSIKATLATQQQQSALSKFIKGFKKKWQGKTDCRTGYVVADCKQYKAPKAKAGAPSTGTEAPAEG
ncbi:MAG TPA: peptidyl-prolyl cis-trans isomerase [Solirubrobacteraceae bacterium]|nr:peptidyl-prolyl cis-trans isomerase [Solirubrobacteraceae bacterium]